MVFSNIQYLRGIAALLVAVGHNLQLIRDKVYASDNALVTHFERTGGIGVDLFFVISGFIMFLISGSSVASLRTTLLFWVKRICRVMPTYWIFTGIVLAFYLTGIPKSEIDFSAYYLLRSYLLLPTLNLQGEMFPLLHVGWTLIYEMFFYFLFGCMLLVRRPLRVMGLSLLLIGLVIAGYSLPTLAEQSVVFATYTNPILLEFLFGIWIAKAYLAGWRLPRGVAIALLIAGSLAMSYFYLDIEATRPFLTGIPAAAVFIGALMLEPSKKPSPNNALKHLGDASYSLYLIHPVLLYGISFLVRFIPVGTAGSALAVFMFATALQIVAALLFFRWVERPLSEALQGRIFASKASTSTHKKGRDQRPHFENRSLKNRVRSSNP